MPSNIKLATIGAAIYLAGVAALALAPAHAGIVEDPVTHWKTYVPDTGHPAPFQPDFWQPWQNPRNTTIIDGQSGAVVNCYRNGNIITCN
jgi:hypothetical protein